ncbi:NHLP leader peptide family RiPP precursor [Parapedobacter tibetensis]|uniref:NHLP leader peptide family RiPP precursor n=1 Tax=Parapedobacter tibetensis TaxID=2972951 RepID=UPI00214DD483|nr:NHLP leader peptide family RiPP precursor [Parapedobacter tibetensis]
MELTKEQKLMQTIINRTWEDEGFKQELIANPMAAIEKLTGERVVIPEGKTLVVRDQTDENTIYINIPAERNFDDMELSEEQLEAVAGGSALLDIIMVLPPKLTTIPVIIR